MVTFAQAQPGIFAGESGGDYNALYGYQNRPGGSFANTRLTDMSVGDVIDFTNPRGDYAAYVRGQVGRTATPVGAYQVVGTTLRGAVDAMGIDPSTPFNQATQDRIGEYIFNTQGTGAWEGYRGPQAGGQGMDQGIMAQSFVEQQPQQQQQPQDPMSNLSRSQRMMLGFAALRDAAASLEGQQSSYFGDTLGGFQQQQMQQEQMDIRRTEQERLRRQGMMQALPELQRALAIARMTGQDTSAIEASINTITVDLGLQPPPQPTLVAGGVGGAAPQAAGGEMSDLDRSLAQADVDLLVYGAVRPSTTAAIDRARAAEEAQESREAAIPEMEQELQDLEYSRNLLSSVINDPRLEGVTGTWQGAIDPNAFWSGLTYDEDERDLVNRIQQLSGEQFLEAFESLKGGGQITEMEGRIATQAQSRIGGRRTSVEGYKNALTEILQVQENNIVRRRNELMGTNDPIPHPVIGGNNVNAPETEFSDGGSSAATQPSDDGWTTVGNIRIRPME